MNGRLYWHFAPSTLRTRFSNEAIEVGKTLYAVGPLEICHNGMHASDRMINALFYAPGTALCLVSIDEDEKIVGPDKVCSRARTAIEIADVENELVEFAIECAERAINVIESDHAFFTPSNNCLMMARNRHYGNANLGDLLDSTLAAGAARRIVWEHGKYTQNQDDALLSAYYAAISAAYLDANSAYFAAFYAKQSAKDRRAEVDWQCNRLNELICPLFKSSQ